MRPMPMRKSRVLQERYDLGALDWTEIDAADTPEQTLRHARAALAL